MLSDEIKQYLFDLGHFNNPAMPTGVDTQEELDATTLTSDAMRTAIRSYQEFMAADFDRLSLEHHGRQGIADGDVGPATMALFDVPRCQCPDFEVAGAVVEGARGRGSWPSGAFAEYPNNHAITVHVIKNGMPRFLEPIFEEVWELVFEAYRDIGMVLIRADRKIAPGTRVTFETLRGSTIGLAIVPSNPTARDYIWAKFDPTYQPRDLMNQWARLIAHEIGHNMSMSHTRGGIMNPSITSGPFTRTAWRGDPAESKLIAYFGGVPVPPRDKPDPPPVDPPPTDPPPSGALVFRGEFEAFVGDKSAGKFIIQPKPRV